MPYKNIGILFRCDGIQIHICIHGTLMTDQVFSFVSASPKIGKTHDQEKTVATARTKEAPFENPFLISFFFIVLKSIIASSVYNAV